MVTSERGMNGLVVAWDDGCEFVDDDVSQEDWVKYLMD